jgi:cholesterol transport system auxiliary component
VSTRRAMLRTLPAAAGAAALAALGGCDTLTNSGPRFDFFVIEDLRAGATAAAAGAPRIGRTLLLSGGPSQALYESDRIVYTRDGASRSYYQYSNWSERPGRRILSLAEARLARGGRFDAVAQTLAGVRGDLVLSLRLDALVHDDTAAPGTLRVAITGELVDWRSRTLVARRTFSQEAPVPSRDARGAAGAANVAVTALLDDLAAWTEASAATVK